MIQRNNPNQEQEIMQWAIGPDGKSKYITDVLTGKDCRCTCRKCGQPLIAKNSEGNIRAPHFAHLGEYAKGQSKECDGGYDLMKHKRAEELIEGRKYVMAPGYVCFHAKTIKFDRVEIEQRNDRSDLQPDIVGIIGTYRILIEIYNTHAVDYNKRIKIEDDNLICMEIDISDVKIEELEDFLFNKCGGREWINNPPYFQKAVKKLKADYPQLQIRKSSDCSHCDFHFECEDKKYKLGSVKQKDATIIFCNKAEIVVKKDSATTKNSTTSNEIITKVQEPLTTHEYLFGKNISPEPIVINEKYPLEPPVDIEVPLTMYYKNIVRDRIFHNTPEGQYQVYKPYKFAHSINVETNLISESNSEPQFRVYTITYANGKFYYTWKDFQDNELTASKYAREPQ